MDGYLILRTCDREVLRECSQLKLALRCETNLQFVSPFTRRSGLFRRCRWKVILLRAIHVFSRDLIYTACLLFLFLHWKVLLMRMGRSLVNLLLDKLVARSGRQEAKIDWMGWGQLWILVILISFTFLLFPYALFLIFDTLLGLLLWAIPLGLWSIVHQSCLCDWKLLVSLKGTNWCIGTMRVSRDRLTSLLFVCNKLVVLSGDSTVNLTLVQGPQTWIQTCSFLCSEIHCLDWILFHRDGNGLEATMILDRTCRSSLVHQVVIRDWIGIHSIRAGETWQLDNLALTLSL